jgi:hypothetical protein
MGDLTTGLKAKGQTGELTYEAKFWLCAVGSVAGFFIASSLVGLLFGVDPLPALRSRIGAAIGVLLGLGLYHAVSRRTNDHLLLFGIVGALGPSGSKPLPFFASLGISLVVVAVTSIVVGMILRFLGYVGMYRTAKPLPPRSDHSLYDAEVDGATGAEGAAAYSRHD